MHLSVWGEGHPPQGERRVQLDVDLHFGGPDVFRGGSTRSPKRAEHPSTRCTTFLWGEMRHPG